MNTITQTPVNIGPMPMVIRVDDHGALFIVAVMVATFCAVILAKLK